MNALSDYLTKSGREESGGLLGAYFRCIEIERDGGVVRVRCRSRCGCCGGRSRRSRGAARLPAGRTCHESCGEHPFPMLHANHPFLQKKMTLPGISTVCELPGQGHAISRICSIARLSKKMMIRWFILHENPALQRCGAKTRLPCASTRPRWWMKNRAIEPVMSAEISVPSRMPSIVPSCV